MYKLAVIGDRDTVLGFHGVGVRGIAVGGAEEARTALLEAARSGEYAVIFLTEQLAAALSDTLASLREEKLPVITAVPGREGSTGLGLRRMKRTVEKAVGVDILFKGEEA